MLTNICNSIKILVNIIMGFCKFIDKYELTKTHNVFLLYKTCVFEPKPYFFFIATQKMPIQFTLSFKNDFILVLYNKINEFLTQTKCLYDMSCTTFY